MTITITEILLYAVALTVLVMTPGPVVVATIAKTLASGWRSSLPLAAGVSIVDVLWPLLAILGLSALVQANAEVLQWMRYIGGAILIWMGWRLIVGSRTALDTDPDPSLMRRNAWQGFLAGVL
ncbi:MAG: LysE family translocator, partial [Pseudomonadota bacterium]